MQIRFDFKIFPCGKVVRQQEIKIIWGLSIVLLNWLWCLKNCNTNCDILFVRTISLIEIFVCSVARHSSMIYSTAVGNCYDTIYEGMGGI